MNINQSCYNRHTRDCDKINGRNALAVNYMKITINKILRECPYRASVVINEKEMMNIIIPGHAGINYDTYSLDSKQGEAYHFQSI